MRVFSETQAADLDLQTARFNVVTYSQIVESQAKQIQILFTQVKELQEKFLAQGESLLITQEMLDQLNQARFGRSSEKRPPDQPLFDTVSSKDTAPPDSATTPGSQATLPSGNNTVPAKKKKKGHGRKAQPQLPVREVIYNLSPEEILSQGLTPFAGQYEVSELINFFPPSVVIEKSMRQKYFGATTESGERAIVTAPGPQKLIEKSRYGIDFAIQTGLDKYESHLPLSRQRKRFLELGLDISEQTLFDQIDLISWYLKENVISRIRASIIASHVLQADETWWANLTDKKKFYLWAMTNEKAVSFIIYNSRSQESAANFLDGFKGILLTDGYQCYKNIKSAERLANDWAHVRRKFIKAETSYPNESKWMVDQIRSLSHIEKEIANLKAPEVLDARNLRSKPIVDEIYSWLLVHKNTILPGGSLGRAIAYALNLWQGLTVFLTDPEVPLTTNLIERLQRDPVVGRKMHYGSRTLRSAQVAGDWYTVIGTCRLNNLSPRLYIKYALTEILAGRSPVLPWDFKTLSP